MLSQYLLIHSEAIKATIKEIQGKNSKAAIYDPSLTHKGGPGVKLTGYLDSPHMLSQYLLISVLNKPFLVGPGMQWFQRAGTWVSAPMGDNR